KPARYSMKLKPIVHHTVVNTIEIIATLALVSQPMFPRPIVAKDALIKPNPGSYNQIQIKATTAEGSTYGAKKARRKIPLPQGTVFARSARASPSKTRIGVLKMVNRMVCQSAVQKAESAR